VSDANIFFVVPGLTNENVTKRAKISITNAIMNGNLILKLAKIG
jgi:hypothetical protein